MPLIHPRISIRDPQEIIRAMLRLKRRRFHHEISRRKFLDEWTDLRIDLEATPEYAEFREKVIARSGGQCERIDKGIRCKRKGKHVHHKAQMSFHPQLALVVDNGEYVCASCHQASHKHTIRST